MFEQKDALCELWIEEPMEVRQHSRLYNLEPIGVGSPMVESLTSYVTRLADAHSNSVNTLVSHEITPHLRQSYLSRSLDQKGHAANQALTVFWRESMTVNGLTSWTGDWVQALEQLTLRHDLRFLTMLSWKDVFSHIRLVWRTQRWCPVCYEEWHQSGSVVYQPLLWALQSIHICPQHALPLQQQCSYANCQHKPLWLSSQAQMGYCPKCNRWLGCSWQEQRTRQTAPNNDEKQQDHWIGHSMGAMLAFAPRLVILPRREVIAETITMYINQVSNGHIAKFVQQFQTNIGNIRDWMQRDKLPQHSVFLRMCLSLDISPLCWLTGDVMKMIAAEKILPRNQVPALPKHKRKAQRKFDAESVKSALEAVLQSSEGSFPPMKQIAEKLGYSHGLLLKKFPKYCRAISARHRDELKKKQGEDIRSALEAILQSSEEAPLSMRQVAKNLGSSHGSLFKKFPELCGAIATRYLDALKKQRIERVQKLCNEVHQATLSIHAQGIYPSSNKVFALVNNKWAMHESKAYATWKTTLEELGCYYQP